MSLTSYEKLRENFINNNTIVNLLHFGRGIFGSDFGTTSFVISKQNIQDYIATYRRLFDKQGSVDNIDKKEKWFFNGKGTYTAIGHNFLKIPGSAIAYWLGDSFIKIYEDNNTLRENAIVFEGLKTRDNERFLRLWYEIYSSKWKPYAKGGAFRRWYGNNEYVVNWGKNGDEVRSFKKSSGANFKFFFQPTITYTALTMYKFSGRYVDNSIFGGGGGGITNTNEIEYLLGFVNSKVFDFIINAISPTLNFEVGQIGKQPLIIESPFKAKIKDLANKNVTISHSDWDSFETSWDFQTHPFIRLKQLESD